MVVKTEPIFTALFSALLLSEVLNADQYAGIAAVIASLGAYQIMEQRRQR
jgi:drug/metabolite transporter (DMT)-like permease